MDTKLLALIATLTLTMTGLMTTYSSTTNELITKFENFKVQYGKAYATQQEEDYRFAIYVSNMKSIDNHNAKKLGWTEKENQFSDLSPAEFKSIYSSNYVHKHKHDKIENILTNQQFVGNVNWVTKGKVQKVKNQGDCGSCWAFSTVASIESAGAIFKGQLGDFSEQQLVDCVSGSNCSDGSVISADQYLEGAGICTEASYPYQGVNGTCGASSCTKADITLKSYSMITQGSTSALMTACDTQPVSIYVSTQGWMNYSGGIMSTCGTSLDHCVLLAGYVQGQYWLVLNSWGTSWGMNGYIKLANPANTCGLSNYASVPHLA